VFVATTAVPATTAVSTAATMSAATAVAPLESVVSVTISAINPSLSEWIVFEGYRSESRNRETGEKNSKA
jgi:hypothetical protein